MRMMSRDLLLSSHKATAVRMDQAPDQLLRVYEGDRLLPFRQLNPPAVFPACAMLRKEVGQRFGPADDLHDLVPGMLEDVHPIAR